MGGGGGSVVVATGIRGVYVWCVLESVSVSVGMGGVEKVARAEEGKMGGAC